MIAPLSRARRVLCLLLGLGALTWGAGCDSAVDILNGVPRVTWVAVTASPAPQIAPARVTVWIADLEGDSVDLAVEWVDGAGEAHALTEAPGSYGLVGLTTRDALGSPAGQPHLILWDVSEVPEGAEVRLRFSPDDRPADDGEGLGATVTSPPFDIGDGLPEPAEPGAAL